MVPTTFCYQWCRKRPFLLTKKHVYCCLEPNPISAVWTANSKRATDSHSRLAWFNTPLSWIKELWISWILANYRLWPQFLVWTIYHLVRTQFEQQSQVVINYYTVLCKTAVPLEFICYTVINFILSVSAFRQWMFQCIIARL